MVAEQFEAASTDGTLVPYFIVRQKDIDMNSANPGVYVHANIRGGGEFGPAWHQAGLKTSRQCIYDDFIAIAQDLIDKKITSPQHLGIEGGSNGGLLVGVMVTQRPDLFSAVVCAVPFGWVNMATRMTRRKVHFYVLSRRTITCRKTRITQRCSLLLLPKMIEFTLAMRERWLPALKILGMDFYTMKT